MSPKTPIPPPPVAALVVAVAVSAGGAGAAEPREPGSIDWVWSSYGTVTTVAGMLPAKDAEDDLNDWDDRWEGGPAWRADLSRPHTAMADAMGNIFIADKESHAIRKVSPGGTITTVAGATPGGDDDGGYNGDGLGTEVMLNNPNGLYVFPDGTVYILDLDNERVRRLGTDGIVHTVFRDKAGFGGGRALWVSPDERTVFYGSGEELVRWTPARGSVAVAGEFVDMGNIDVDRDGNVLVTDRNSSDEPGAHRVWKVDPATGSRTAVAGNGSTTGGGDGFPAIETGLNQVRGVACDGHGGFFLCTMKDPAGVWYVDAEGTIHLVMAGRGSGNVHEGDGIPLYANRFAEKISEPRAVTLAPNGDLLITTNDRGFVRRVENVLPPAAPDAVELAHDPVLGPTLYWESRPGGWYAVEAMVMTPGASPAWTELARVVGRRTGDVTWFEDAFAPEASKLYRVRAVE